MRIVVRLSFQGCEILDIVMDRQNSGKNDVFNGMKTHKKVVNGDFAGKVAQRRHANLRKMKTEI
jgi:hypothetical protein